MKNKLLLLLSLFLIIPTYGQYWEPQVSGVGANLNDVYCITEDNVAIVGTGGTILKTTDGGTNWIQKISGTTADLEKVQFINSNIGYAVGSGGILLKTSDGGENWNSINTGTTINLSGLAVVNENIFYISGENGFVKRTNDGGNTFIDQSYATTFAVSTIQFLNENVGYASAYDQYGYSDNTSFVKTIDGGANWTIISSEQVSTFYFLNENTGFIRNSFGISKTTDGGLSMVTIGETGFITADIFSLNENVVWNVEDNFTLCNCSWFCIKKIDLTLSPELQQTSNCYIDTNGGIPFSAIHFASETKGYAVGWWGMILKNATGSMENLATKEFAKKEFVTMYPNPTSNQITFSFVEKQAASFSVEITDFLGKKIMTKFYENQHNTTINIESFSNGIYLVKVTTAQGTSVNKIIKE